MKSERFNAAAPAPAPSGALEPAKIQVETTRPYSYRVPRPQTLTLFAQTLALTVLGLLAAIAITVVVIFNLPPPMPDFYRVSDIAQVFNTGRPFVSSERPPLIRRLSPSKPTGQVIPPDGMGQVRQELAEKLHVDPKSILMIIDFPRFADRQAINLVRAQMARGAGAGQEHFLIAPFSVSLRQRDGQWLEVAPAHSLKPSAWQQRLLLWLGLSLLALIPMAYLFARRLAAPIAAFAAAAERLGRDPRAPPPGAARLQRDWRGGQSVQ